MLVEHRTFALQFLGNSAFSSGNPFPKHDFPSSQEGAALHCLYFLCRPIMMFIKHWMFVQDRTLALSLWANRPLAQEAHSSSMLSHPTENWLLGIACTSFAGPTRCSYPHTMFILHLIFVQRIIFALCFWVTEPLTWNAQHVCGARNFHILSHFVLGHSALALRRPFHEYYFPHNQELFASNRLYSLCRLLMMIIPYVLAVEHGTFAFSFWATQPSAQGAHSPRMLSVPTKNGLHLVACTSFACFS